MLVAAQNECDTTRSAAVVTLQRAMKNQEFVNLQFDFSLRAVILERPVSRGLDRYTCRCVYRGHAAIQNVLGPVAQNLGVSTLPMPTSDSLKSFDGLISMGHLAKVLLLDNEWKNAYPKYDYLKNAYTSTYNVENLQDDDAYEEIYLADESTSTGVARNIELGDALQYELHRKGPFCIATFQSHLPSQHHAEMCPVCLNQVTTAYTVPICVTNILEVEIVFGDIDVTDHRIILRNGVGVLARLLDKMQQCIKDENFTCFNTLVCLFFYVVDDHRAERTTHADIWYCRRIREWTDTDRQDPTLSLWLPQRISDVEQTNFGAFGDGQKYAYFGLQCNMQASDKTYYYEIYEPTLLILYRELVNKVRERFDTNRSYAGLHADQLARWESRVTRP